VAASPFLLLVQKKEAKEKDTPMSCPSGTLRFSPGSGPFEGCSRQPQTMTAIPAVTPSGPFPIRAAMLTRT
ncbi:MAG: hypothetical protein ACPG4N_02650, partial [Gammaproteobacteria bacterium]